MRHKKNSTFEGTPNSGTVFFFSLLVAGYSVQVSHAGEFAYGFGYFAEYSDNILRAPVSPVSEVTNSAIVGVAYRESDPTFDAYMLTLAEYRDYRNDNIFDDGGFYYADVSAIWRIFPQRLTWYLVDRYGQVTVDATRSDTPANRTSANAISTGPDIFFRLGQVNTLVFGLRYGNTLYSEGHFGDTRYGVSARWLYAANSEMTYSLNYEGQQVRHDDGAVANNALIDDFLRHDLFLRAERRQARARFLLDLGVTRIDREKTPATSGNLARLTWTQQLTSGSSAGILLAREYLDAGTVLLSTATSPAPVPGDPPVSTEAGQAANDLFFTKRAEVYYNRIDTHFDLNSSIYYRDSNYVILDNLDRSESGVRLELIYRPFTLLATTLYASYADVQYQSIVRDDRDGEAGLRLTYRLNTNFSATLDGRTNWRNSTLDSQDYTDRRLLFSLTYSSSSLFTPAKR